VQPGVSLLPVWPVWLPSAYLIEPRLAGKTLDLSPFVIRPDLRIDLVRKNNSQMSPTGSPEESRSATTPAHGGLLGTQIFGAKSLSGIPHGQDRSASCMRRS
jgi:hypothetical protein